MGVRKAIIVIILFILNQASFGNHLWDILDALWSKDVKQLQVLESSGVDVTKLIHEDSGHIYYSLWHWDSINNKEIFDYLYSLNNELLIDAEFDGDTLLHGIIWDIDDDNYPMIDHIVMKVFKDLKQNGISAKQFLEQKNDRNRNVFEEIQWRLKFAVFDEEIRTVKYIHGKILEQL